jgi:S-adenosylmethionine synthetase
MAAKDWTKIYQDNRYKGRWVALKDDEETVIGSGLTLREAVQKAKEAGYPDPIVMRVPKKLMYFIG